MTYAHKKTRCFQPSRKIVKDFEMDQRIARYLQWKTPHFLEHTLLGYLILWGLYLSLSLIYFITLQVVDNIAMQIILFHIHTKLSRKECFTSLPDPQKASFAFICRFTLCLAFEFFFELVETSYLFLD